MDDGAELRNFTVIYLKAPLEVAEDHVTFMFGIFVLFSFATGCIVLASKLPAGRFYFYLFFHFLIRYRKEKLNKLNKLNK